MIKQINAYGDWCKKEFGTRLFFPSDEFYIKAELPLPNDDFYEDYSQIENGVGMLTDMKSAVEYELEDISPYSDFKAPRAVSIATGYAAYEHILSLARMLEDRFEGLTIKVYPIKNEFFGESITVSGLLTGKDLEAQLRDKELGDELLVSSNSLRADGDVFLDDVSPEALGEALGVRVTPTDSEATAFISSVLGIQ